MTENFSKFPALVRFLPGFIKRRIESRPNLVKILDNIGWLFFDKILRMGVGLIVGVWVARYLGPEQFGKYNYVITVTFLFSAVSTFGMDSIVLRSLINEPDQQRYILGSAVIVQVFGGFFSWIFSMCLAYLIFHGDANSFILVAILGTASLFKFSDTVKFIHQAQLRSKYSVIAENIVFLLLSMFKLVLLFYHASLSAFILALWLESFMAAVALLLIYTRYGGRLFSWRFKKERLFQLIRDGAPLMVSGLAMAGYMRMDQIMLGKMLDEEAVGIFSAALRISEVWYFVPLAVMASLFPSVVAAKNACKVQYVARLEFTHTGMVFLALVMAIPISFVADFIIVMLYGKQYIMAGNVLAIHIWSSIFIFIGVASHHWFVAENLQRYVLFRTLFGALVNFVLNFLLIPDYGPIGAAIASLVAHSMVNVFLNIFSSKTRFVFMLQIKCIFMIPLWDGSLFRHLGLNR